MKTGELIKELRLKKGMTQEDLAAKTDVSARTIQRIENSEVEARAYTLQNIATALEVDFEMLNTNHNHGSADADKGYIWLPLLHLSGLFNLLFPPFMIWLIKKDSVKEMNEHGIAVLNFQLSILLYEILIFIPAICIPAISYVQIKPVLAIVILFGVAMVLVNTLKIFNGQPYKYLLSINILKPKL